MLKGEGSFESFGSCFSDLFIPFLFGLSCWVDSITESRRKSRKRPGVGSGGVVHEREFIVEREWFGRAW